MRESEITDHQAKYFANLLTRKISPNDKEKIISTILDAQIEPKPHQIDAALFAFRSPFASGAILADEVGLGKTIEAGLVIAQKWAEGKRKILIICPSSLRQQWRQELQEKFFLESIIIEGKNYNIFLKESPSKSPFNKEEIIICSYQFASNKETDISFIDWDLVVIDEAHRLRNVYKPSNKIANILKKTLVRAPKLLLTATPLQNSLLELYGLVSFIEEKVFGDQKSFKDQFINRSNEVTLSDLKKRLQRFTYRTLRKQVMEYINYTNRIPYTQSYLPSEKEQELYDLVSNYLQRDIIYALPASQRQLTTLIMRKLLASSSYAIKQTLNTLADRLEQEIKTGKFTKKDLSISGIFPEFELLDELEEELSQSDTIETSTENVDLQLATQEVKDLRQYASIATSIIHNNKADALQHGLGACFEELEKLGAMRKALIFTESTRTQRYLFEFLSNNGFKEKIVLYNGSNTDPASTDIYHGWLEENDGTDRITHSITADRKAAIIDHFKNHAEIMIATEAAAEGINLQFCSLVVNYDLPWNPQRVEQRIGRCHRYGQKYDVVVLNFLNESNAADIRVLELLSEKFKLFEGIFGASDEVLGAIESGVDIEKRIADIYQNCRTTEDIKYQFDKLQNDLEAQITNNMKTTKQKLLENFDKDVHEKLRISLDQSKEYLNKHENWLWKTTRFSLKDNAVFNEDEHSFELVKPIFDHHVGMRYQMKPAINAHMYRVSSSLAQQLLNHTKVIVTPLAAYDIYYSSSPEKISSINSLLGKSGYICVTKLCLINTNEEEYIITSGIVDGRKISDDQCKRLLDLDLTNPKTLEDINAEDKIVLSTTVKSDIKSKQAEIAERNSIYFDEELEKIDSWSEDKKLSLELKIKELDKEIKTRKTESRKLVKLEEKVSEQRAIKDLEKKRNSLRRDLFDKQDEIDIEKDKLLDTIQSKLESESSIEELFTIKWKLI
jgi:ERCC4-related helicase